MRSFHLPRLTARSLRSAASHRRSRTLTLLSDSTPSRLRAPRFWLLQSPIETTSSSRAPPGQERPLCSTPSPRPLAPPTASSPSRTQPSLPSRATLCASNRTLPMLKVQARSPCGPCCVTRSGSDQTASSSARSAGQRRSFPNLPALLHVRERDSSNTFKRTPLDTNQVDFEQIEDLSHQCGRGMLQAGFCEL